MASSTISSAATRCSSSVRSGGDSGPLSLRCGGMRMLLLLGPPGAGDKGGRGGTSCNRRAGEAARGRTELRNARQRLFEDGRGHFRRAQRLRRRGLVMVVILIER